MVDAAAGDTEDFVHCHRQANIGPRLVIAAGSLLGMKINGRAMAWMRWESTPVTRPQAGSSRPRYFRPTEVETLLGDATRHGTSSAGAPR